MDVARHEQGEGLYSDRLVRSDGDSARRKGETALTSDCLPVWAAVLDQITVEYRPDHLVDALSLAHRSGVAAEQIDREGKTKVGRNGKTRSASRCDVPRAGLEKVRSRRERRADGDAMVLVSDLAILLSKADEIPAKGTLQSIIRLMLPNRAKSDSAYSRHNCASL
jgi:hypothetical protein